MIKFDNYSLLNRTSIFITLSECKTIEKVVKDFFFFILLLQIEYRIHTNSENLI